MNRLRAELQRLYFSERGEPARALLLEAARPAGWEQLARVWQGVQAELELPAPAIAVSGADAYQLWFALAEPLPVHEAVAFLEALCARYLAEVPKARLRLHPSVASAEALPPKQAAAGQWSAFLAPDLAPLFAEERWLDLPPGDDAQAELLSALQCTRPADLRRALQQLQQPQPEAADAAPAAVRHDDPRAFLLQVMNDPAVPMALRIEAAKALLPR